MAGIAAAVLVCTTLSAVSGGAEAAPAEPLAHWPLDELGGATAADVAGGNDAVLEGGPVWRPAAGRVGGALELDGSNDLATVPDASLSAGFPARSAGTTGDFTLMAWIRPDALGDRNPIMSKQGTSSPGARRGFMFSAGTPSGDGRLSVEVHGSDLSSGRTELTSPAPLRVGEWQHVAASYSFVGAGSSQLRLFVDGVEVAATTTAQGPVQSNPQPFDIGRYFWSSGYARYFDGLIDEVRVLDVALTETEVAELAFGEAPNRPPTASIAVTPPAAPPPFEFGFDASASGDPDGSIVTYAWDFGDGRTGSGATVSHTYAGEGTYQVVLTVTDDDGAPATETTTVTARLPGSAGQPVAAWPLGETGGVQAADAIGGNDLDLNGNVVWRPDEVDGVLRLDGSTTFGARADGALLGSLPAASGDPADDFSITAWVKLDQATKRNPILSKQGTSSAGNRRGFLLTTGEGGTAGRLSFEVFSDESSKSTVSSTAPLTSGPGAQWHHVAATYDFVGDGTSEIRLYVDGELVGSTDAAVGPVQGNPQSLELGRYFWSKRYARYFDGLLDDVRIFDAALDRADVEEVLGERPSPPVVSFSATPLTGDAPLSVDFDASATTDDGPIVAYDWDFGDGGSGSGVTVSHQYGSAGSYVARLTVTDADGGSSSDEVTIVVTDASSPPPVDELLVFEVDRLVTTADRGFPWDQPPMASSNGDWTSPIDFADGTFHVRAEIGPAGQPVSQTMRLQFCVWQFNLTRETCTSTRTIDGDPGNVVTWSQSIASMWKKKGVPIDWSQPRQRYGIAIKNAAGQPISDFAGWNWFGEDPDDWYPLDLRFTVVVVADGASFGGWSNYVD